MDDGGRFCGVFLFSTLFFGGVLLLVGIWNLLRYRVWYGWVMNKRERGKKKTGGIRDYGSEGAKR